MDHTTRVWANLGVIGTSNEQKKKFSRSSHTGGTWWLGVAGTMFMFSNALWMREGTYCNHEDDEMMAICCF